MKNSCQVGISFVNIENAILNLETEIPDWNFNRVVKDAQKNWNDYLSRIRVKGGTHKQRVKFYTDLMHTAIGKHIYNDIDGSYTDMTGPEPIVRQIPPDQQNQPKWQFLDMDGLWGTHWNLNILWSLFYPDSLKPTVQSIHSLYLKIFPD